MQEVSKPDRKVRTIVGLGVFVAAAALIVHQIEVPHPWVYGPRGSVEHIMKAPQNRRWIVAHAYGVLAAQNLDMAEIRVRGNELPMGLEAHYYDGAAHHQKPDFAQLDEWVKQIQAHIPDIQQGFFYDGIMRVYVLEHGDSPDEVMAFAEDLSSATGTEDLSSGIKTGLQQLFGDDMSEAIDMASRYPTEIHHALYEELGWRVGSDEGFSGSHWKQYQRELPQPAGCWFAEGMVLGALITALDEESTWWPEVQDFRGDVSAECTEDIYSGIAEALLIVLGDDPVVMKQEAKQITFTADYDAVLSLMQKKQGDVSQKALPGLPTQPAR